MIVGTTPTGSGKPVGYQQVPFADFQARLKQAGMSEAFARGYADMMAA